MLLVPSDCRLETRQRDKSQLGILSYVLLLRALNCLAELAPPFRLVQLGRDVLGGPLGEEVRFDLQLGILERDEGEAGAPLIELTRDLAELFQHQVDESDQLSGMLGRIECLEIDPNEIEDVVAMRRIWSLR